MQKNYSIWNPDPKKFEAFLKTLPDAAMIARIKSVTREDLAKTDEQKRLLVKRLLPYQTPVTSATMQMWVGNGRRKR